MAHVLFAQNPVLMETKMKKIILITASAALMTACSTTGSVERNTAYGAAGGVYSGNQADPRLSQNAGNQDLKYDSFGERYYYVDPATGNTYWQNGALRTSR